MRTITILTVMAITIAVLAYHFMREDTGSEQSQAMRSQTGADSTLEVQDRTVQDRLDRLASALQHYQQTNQEKWQQAQSQQARLHKMLADLESRLRSVEAADGESTTDAAVSNSVEPATDTAVSNNGAEKPKSDKVSEGDVGHWMDEVLRVEYLDQDSTKLATEQATKSLEKVSGVNLQDMRCGKSFCRATFVHKNGEQPDIRDLFGEPPFVNEGFTINGPDGRVTLYFTRPGESLEKLRGEAREAVQAGLGWRE